MNTLPAPNMRTGRRGVVVAMVLGTALTAFAPALAPAAAVGTGEEIVTDISRYCTACWRNARLPADCWTDCTQDVFTRLLERVAPDAWQRVLQSDGDERREFLRAIDAVKKRTQRGRKWTPLTDDSVADRREGEERQRDAERQTVARAADEVLSPRQQRILQMTFEGWSVHEIAVELQTTPERISDEKYKAVRKLREYLCPEVQG